MTFSHIPLAEIAGIDPFLAGLVFGLLSGVLFGLLLDRFVLRPLVLWHARLVRRGRT